MASPFLPRRKQTNAERVLEDAAANYSRIQQLLALGRTDVSEADLTSARETAGLALAQVEAEARGGTPEPTSGPHGIPLPAIVAVATGEKRVHPKMWVVESRRFIGRAFEMYRWVQGAEREAKKRGPGDVSFPYRCRVIKVLGEMMREGKSRAEMTYILVGAMAGMSRETARKVIRWLEDICYLDTWNRTDRRDEDNLVLRVANGYFPITPEEDAMQAKAASPGSAEAIVAGDGVSVEAVWMGRLARQIARATRWFKLAGRPLGLNLNPLRPAPA